MGTWKTALCTNCGEEREVTRCWMTVPGRGSWDVNLCAPCIRERREAGVEVEAV